MNIWICTREIRNEEFELLFEKGKKYQEQDDRGEADDIAICLLSEKKTKSYLIDNWVRDFFVEKSKIEAIANKLEEELIKNAEIQLLGKSNTKMEATVFKALYVIHRGKDLGVFEFTTEANHWVDFEELVNFHFEERLEPTEDQALFYKKDYFKEESEEEWDTIEIIDITT